MAEGFAGLPEDEWFSGRRPGGLGDARSWRFLGCGAVPLAVLATR